MNKKLFSIIVVGAILSGGVLSPVDAQDKDTPTVSTVLSPATTSSTTSDSTTSTIPASTTTPTSTTITSPSPTTTTSVTSSSTSIILEEPNPEYEEGDIPVEETLTDEEMAEQTAAQEVERQALLDVYRLQLEEADKKALEVSTQINALTLEIAALENEISLLNTQINEALTDIDSKTDAISALDAESDLNAEELSAGSIEFFLEDVRIDQASSFATNPEKFFNEQIKYTWFDSMVEDASKLTLTRRLLETERETLQESVSSLETEISDATLILEEKKAEKEELEIVSTSLSYGVSEGINGGVFPIGGPYGQPLINSWGFPRSGGRSHKGIDIFAPYGTPLVAVESGVITKVGTVNLGGLRIWLAGDSGTYWYYAHLSGIEPSLQVGQRVEVGDVIGFVGDSGNAQGTPPHLHLQMHPGNGDPINPYPTMKFWSDARNLALEVLGDSVES